MSKTTIVVAVETPILANIVPLVAIALESSTELEGVNLSASSSNRSRTSSRYRRLQRLAVFMRHVIRARPLCGSISGTSRDWTMFHRIRWTQTFNNNAVELSRFFEVISHGVASRSDPRAEQTAVACFCLNRFAGKLIERQVIFVIRHVFGRDVVKITLIHNHVVIANGRVELFELRVDSDAFFNAPSSPSYAFIPASVHNEVRYTS